MARKGRIQIRQFRQRMLCAGWNFPIVVMIRIVSVELLLRQKP